MCSMCVVCTHEYLVCMNEGEYMTCVHENQNILSNGQEYLEVWWNKDYATTSKSSYTIQYRKTARKNAIHIEGILEKISEFQ